jgi:SPP1 gp7 family putative phage head morphogenesis protein
LNIKDLFARKTTPVVIEQKDRVSKKLGQRLAIVKSPLDPNALFSDMNPDDLVMKKGGVQIYKEMMKDYQVKALIELRNVLIFGNGWELVNPVDVDGNEMEEMKEITDFLQLNLDEWLRGDLTDYLEQIGTAMYLGYSVTEMIFATKEWNGKTRIILDKFSHIAPDSIIFDIDDYGELKDEGGFVQFKTTGRESLDPNKFVILVWNKTEGNPYGNSDLRAAYVPWFSKKEVTKYRVMFLEKYGIPYVLASYDPAIDATETAQIETIIKSLQAGGGAAVPNDLEIKLETVDQKGAESFKDAIQQMDRQISTALLMPDLLGFSGEAGTGSLARAKQQADIFFNIIKSYQRVFEESVMNEQVIKRIVDLNFSGVEKYPKFRFKPAQEEEEVESVKTYIELIKTGKVMPTEEDVNHMREVLGFPPNDVDLIEPETQETTTPKQPSSDTPTSKPEEKEEPTPKDDVKEQESDSEFKFDNTTDLVGVEKYMNFQKIDEELTSLEERTVTRVSKIFDNSRKELSETLLRVKPIENENLKFINNIKIPLIPNARTQYERAFDKASALARADFKEEVNRQVPESQKGKPNFAIIDEPNLDLRGAREFLKSLAKSTAFKLADDQQNALKKSVRNILYKGIKEGRTTADMMNDIDLAYEPYISKLTGSATGARSAYRLSTTVRTNTTNFYNQARIASTNDAAASGLITHYQYTSVLDNRTSDICNELSGTVFPISDIATLQTVQPSRHFNCRSILSEVTIFGQERMQEGLANGSLKPKLNKPDAFYDGFKTPLKEREQL